MGFVPQQAVYNVDFSGTALAGLDIAIRQISTDELIELSGLMSGVGPDGEGAGLGHIDALLTRFAGLIHRWNVETPDGTPVPPSREALGRQDLSRFVLPVLRACIDAISGVGEELGKDSGSGPPSLAALLPMEPLSGSLSS